MFYRIAITLLLLGLPLSAAHASYLQNYKASSSTSSEAVVDTPASNDRAIDSIQKEEGQTEMKPMIEGIEDDTYLSGEWVILEDATEITRGGFTAELVRSLYTQGQIDGCFASISPSQSADFALVFTDVSVTHAYAKEICIAMRDGIVRGYTDGSFVPERMVTFAESAKILSRAYALAPFADLNTKGPWYAEHVRALLVRSAVPVSITKIGQKITTVEATDMIDRIAHNVTWMPAQKEEVLFPPNVRKANLAPQSTTSDTSADSSTPSAPTSRAQTSSSASSTAPASSEGSFWDLF